MLSSYYHRFLEGLFEIIYPKDKNFEHQFFSGTEKIIITNNELNELSTEEKLNFHKVYENLQKQCIEVLVADAVDKNLIVIDGPGKGSTIKLIANIYRFLKDHNIQCSYLIGDKYTIQTLNKIGDFNAIEVPVDEEEMLKVFYEQKGCLPSHCSEFVIICGKNSRGIVSEYYDKMFNETLYGVAYMSKDNDTFIVGI